MRSATSSRAREAFWVAGLLALASGLRVARLGWGLPEHFFPDEGTIFWRSRSIVLTGDLHTGFVSYPPLVMYLVAGVYGLVALASPTPLAEWSVTDLVWWGRLTMAAVSVATVAAVVGLGCRVSGPATGLLAGLFLAVLPLHVIQSHVICTDVPLTLLVVLALLAAVRLGSRPGWAGVATSGLLSGLAAGAKYPGAIVSLAAGWRALEGVARALREGDRRAAGRWVAAAAVMAVAVLAGFTLAFPDWARDLEAIRRRFLYESFVSRQGRNPVGTLPPEGLRGTPLVYQLAILLPAALGPPLAVLALAGMARMAWKPGAHGATLLAFALPYFLFFATARSVFPRYYLPLTPVLAIAAAELVLAGVRATPRLRAAAAGATVVAAGYALALSLSLTAHTGTRPQHELRTRLEARLAEERGGNPVVARIPEPMGYTGLNWVLRGLPLRELPLTLDRDWLARTRPDLIIVTDIHEILALRNRPRSEAAETLRALAAGTLPYRLITDVRAPYLHQRFYAWLDPLFRVAFERGEMGFRVYALDRAAVR